MLRFFQSNLVNHKTIQSLTSLCNKFYSSENNSETLPQTTEVETLDQATARFKHLSVNGSPMVTENVLNSMVGNKLFRELPILHVHGCKNNTKAHLVEYNGRSIIYCSCGSIGFKNSKKSTSVAGQALGLTVGFKAKKLGISTVRVMLYGVSSRRLECLKGLVQAGVKVISLTDNTPIHHGLGRRPRKTPRG